MSEASLRLVYRMVSMDRRKFIQSGALFGLTTAAFQQSANATIPATPTESEGPFYPVTTQNDRDFDLTRIKGKSGIAKGTQIIISGEVLDTDGRPIEDVTVDLWQANAFGRYRHPQDPNTAPIDDNFQGWAIVKSGQKGGFRLKTIIPGAYPATRNWIRPPHIHFKISKRGFQELVTQMYFPDMPLNSSDRLLLSKNPAERDLMIAKKLEDKKDNLDVYYYRIVLKQA